MNCFPCFRSQRSMKSHESKDQGNPGGEAKATDANNQKAPNKNMMEGVNQAEILAQTFNFRELATATRNFRQERLLGEGGFGRVYKGTLASTGQVVAVKQLDRHGLPGNKEFLAEISKISLLSHENLVKLIGYCADGDQRLLVYEFMPGGSLQDHLLDISSEKKPLDWFTRMKIASGACNCLEYLHTKANPPVIYCDLKPSNILLDKEFNPKLSNFGLTKLSPSGDHFNIAPRAMGTYGYCAPEYQSSGQLTMQSDVYSFGVILLELISGRRAEDTNKPIDEQNLVTWAQPFFRDPKKFPELADPLLEKRFPEKDLNQAIAIAAMCLQEEPTARPLMSDVAATLSFLSVEKVIIMPTPKPPATPPVEERVFDHNQVEHKAGDSSDSHEDTDSENGHDDDDDNDAFDREDAHIENHQIQDGDMSHHQNNDNSDSEDGDSVGSEDNDEEEEPQYTTSESRNWVNSRLLSMGEGIIANREMSTISRDRSVSLESNGSISSSDNSSRVSLNNSDLSNQRSNKISSNKSRRVSEVGSGSSSRRSRMEYNKLAGSMSQGSSIDTHEGNGSLSHKSSRRSRTKSKKHDYNSDSGSESGSLSSGHSSPRGSELGSIH